MFLVRRRFDSATNGGLFARPVVVFLLFCFGFVGARVGNDLALARSAVLFGLCWFVVRPNFCSAKSLRTPCKINVLILVYVGLVDSLVGDGLALAGSSNHRCSEDSFVFN